VRRSDATCRVTAVSLAKALITIEDTGSIIDVQCDLIGEKKKNKIKYGVMQAAGGWPQNVRDTLEEFISAVEDHVAGVLFNEEESTDGRTNDEQHPIGLITPTDELGRLADDEADQL